MQFLDVKEIERRYRKTKLMRSGSTFAGPLKAAEQHAYYAGLDDSKVHLVACRILWGVNHAHPLVDGNKRAAISLTDEFLSLNNMHLEGDEDALYELAYEATIRSLFYLPVLMLPLLGRGASTTPFEDRYPRVVERLAQ